MRYVRGPSAPSICGATRSPPARCRGRAGARRRWCRSRRARTSPGGRATATATSSAVRCSSTSAARTRVSGPVQRGQCVEVDAPLDGAQGVEIDLVEGLGDGRRARRADAAHVGDRRAVLGDDGHDRGARPPAVRRPARAPRRAWPTASRNDSRGGRRTRPTRAARRPARRRAARRRGRGATAPPRSRSRPSRRRRTRNATPTAAQAARRTGCERRRIPVTNSKHGDGHGDDRRGAEEGAELGPGQHVERDADDDGEDVRPAPTSAARPTAQRRGRPAPAPSAVDRGRRPAPLPHRGPRPTTGRGRRRAR